MKKKRENWKRKLIALYRLLSKQFILFVFPLFFFSGHNTYAIQDSTCDEVMVSVYVDQMGSAEINSVICDKVIYLSVSEIFDFLKIRNEELNGFERIEGFFIKQDDTFTIDRSLNQIVFRGKKIELHKNELISTKDNLFLKADYFGTIFGLHCKFSFRNLSVSLKSDVELPSVKAARHEKMRLNLMGLQKNFIADTTIVRERPLLHLGVVTWDAQSNQRINGFNDNWVSLGLGALVGGGEFTAKLNYNTMQSLLPRNQFYQWRYVNNENTFLKQLTVGKIGVQSISSIYRPVIGVQLSNAPTYLKKTFGTYVLSDYTKPNWLVEVYINNALVDYTHADPSGFFSFNIPLIYGNTSVSLRFYGPWGEEESSTIRLGIPHNFLPAQTFEYHVGSGMIEDDEHNIFAQAHVNYGLTRSITLGAGAELNTSLKKNPIIPFARASVRLPQNITLSSEYSHYVGYKGMLGYTSPSNFQLELYYAKYLQEQEAVLFNYDEERRAILSKQFHVGKFYGFSRILWRQNLLGNGAYTNLEWLLSGSAYGLNLNLTTNAYFSTLSEPRIYSRLSTSLILPKQIVFSPQIEYDYNSGNISSLRGDLRKKIFRNADLQVSYNQNFQHNQFYLNLGVNFDLGFSRAGLSGNFSKLETSLSQSIRGSMIFDPHENQIQFNNRSFLGMGSLKFIVFLDINENGKRDGSEPQIEGIDVISTKGGFKEVTADGSTVFKGLEPYVSYNFKLNTTNGGRIDWKLKYQTLNVYVNPNQLKVIEVPMSVVGEVAGYVYESGKGAGGIKINIRDVEQKLIASIITESDGYFAFLGLKSGEYTAQLDPAQIEKFKWEGTKTFYDFNIKNTKEGDYVDHLEFDLQASGKDSLPVTDPLPLEEGPAISNKNDNTHNIGRENDTLPNQGIGNTMAEGVVYKVQLYSSIYPVDKDDDIFENLKNVQVYEYNGTYNYTWGGTHHRYEAKRLQDLMWQRGFKDAFVVPFYDNRRLNPRQVEGRILFKGEQLDGIGGIKVVVYDSVNKPYGSALSEADGNFSISGLRPGSYTVSLDKEQLSGINMRSLSNSLEFLVHDRMHKNIDTLKFVLEALETEAKVVPKNIVSDNRGLIFRVQVLTSKPKLSVKNNLLKGLSGVKRYEHQGLYKYTWGEGRTLQEVRPLKRQLRNNGFQDAFIVPFYNGTRLNMQDAVGRILVNSSGHLFGLEGIRIYIYDSNGDMVTTLASERDGHFSFLGLKPGVYEAQLDQVQLKQLQLKTNQGTSRFQIGINNEGDLSDPLEFILEENEAALVPTYDKEDQGGDLVFKIQIAASNVRLSPDHPTLADHRGIEMYVHQNMYKYTIERTTSLSGANRLQKVIRSNGDTDAFVVVFLNNKRISIEEALQILKWKTR